MLTCRKNRIEAGSKFGLHRFCIIVICNADHEVGFQLIEIVNGNESLPEEIRLAQEKVDSYHKEQALKKQIGKFYISWNHPGEGQVSHIRQLRHIYTQNDDILVDEWYYDNWNPKIEFKSWKIEEAISNHIGNNFSSFSEINGKVYYDNLKQIVNIPQIKEMFQEASNK